MLIDGQFVDVKVNASSIEHYKMKGYDVRMNHKCRVKAEDLTPSSNIKVKVKCDYCGDIIEKTFQKYNKQRKVVKKDACYKCFPIKQKEVCNVLYDVDSTLQLTKVNKKAQQTIKQKYGVTNVMQSHKIQDKFRNTMLDKYGVEYAQQCKKIREKSKQTLIDNYGVERVIDIKDMKSICNNFEYVNSKKVSKPQRKISDYINGKLNINIGGYFIDILLKDYNLAIEYDGSGHDLSVKLGSISEEDFKIRENNKKNILLEQGYKYLIIKNPTGKTINDYRLKEINQYIETMKDSDISFAIFNIQ
jgi:very-short-patch-repair endonuclease